MNNLFERKKNYIELLQKYNGWGINKEAADSLLSDVEIVDTDFQNATYSLQTNLLVNTNKIVSPINLDTSLELPITELFIDNDNFIVFTTKCIHSCRNSSISQIKYTDILEVDEMSVIESMRKRLVINKIEQFIDINLILSDGSKIPITIEYGISFRPIIYFLTTVNKQKIEL